MRQTQSVSSLPRWIGSILFGIGLLLLGIAAWLLISEMRFLSTAKRATAEIVAVNRESMSNANNRSQGTGYRVVFEFVADDGRTVTVPSKVVSSSTSYRVGDRAEIDYIPGRPGGATLVRWVDRWLAPTIVGGIGVMFVFFGGIFLFSRTTSGQFFRGRSQGWQQTYEIGRSPGPVTDDRATGDQPKSRGVLIAAGIGVALVVGFLLARLTGSAATGPANAAANPAVAKRDLAAANDNNHGSTGNWPDGNWTVAAPPAVTEQAPRQNLYALSRAFLARPEQAADIRQALRAQATSLPGLCPALTFQPAELLLKSPPPPRFDATGAMVDGALRQRFSGQGCGEAHPMFNIWVITALGLPVRTVAAYTGTTLADIDLQRDATPIAIIGAANVIRGCPRLAPLDTKFVGYDQPGSNPARPWQEHWLVAGCGKFARVTMHFAPDTAAKRTAIIAPASEARLLDLSVS